MVKKQTLRQRAKRPESGMQFIVSAIIAIVIVVLLFG